MKLKRKKDMLADLSTCGEMVPSGHIINRELSWLSFNLRVLEEARDKQNPVFERLKFLSITASNLDEFYMVRVSGLKELYNAGVSLSDASGMTPAEQLEKISEKARFLTNEKYKCYKQLIKILKRKKILFKKINELTKEQKIYTKNYFLDNIFPLLTPIAVDSRPFPTVSNRSLNLIVELNANDEKIYAVVQIPSNISRLLVLPPINTNKHKFILIEELIKKHISALFPGYNAKKCFAFRITRDSDIEIEDDDADDLLTEIEKSINQRNRGNPVRLETEKKIFPEIKNYLKESLMLGDADIYENDGPLDLTFLMPFAEQPGFEHLKNKPYIPQMPPAFVNKNIFDAIDEEDVLIHHPYETFDCVLDFVRQAADDPNVLAIKHSLYRVSGNSPIVLALIKAAENGKQVTVVVELKARFDEENNILWAKKLEKAGCHVIYGLSGLKIHCKVCLVIRQNENGSITRYVHFGTGNYNDTTAKLYTDMGFFTKNEDFGHDASALFNVLTGYSMNMEWKKLAVSPASLRSLFEKNIENEINNAKEGKPALIMAKMNSLVDPEMISLFYKASEVGVKIDLLVRGICCLKPGIKGVSENIRVISIVDRFLEHTRAYYFENGGNALAYLSSADLMPRNLNRRVETAFPIENEKLKKQLIDFFLLSISDNVKARVMQPDGTYLRQKKQKNKIRSQQIFMENAERNYSEAIKRSN